MASQSADHRGCNVTRFGGEKHSRGVFDHSFQAMYISRGETTTPKNKQKYIPFVNYNTKKGNRCFGDIINAVFGAGEIC